MRYFLIDKVTELVVGERVRGVKNVTLSDDVLHDHFPDHPILPGVLVIEAAAQLAGFLLELTLNKRDSRPKRALLAQIDKAKFYRACGPGDQLDIMVRIESTLEAAAQVTADAKVGSEQVMRAGLTFCMRTIESERVHEQRRILYGIWTRDLETPVVIL